MGPPRCLPRSWRVGVALAVATVSLGLGRPTGGIQFGWRREPGVQSRSILTWGLEVPVGSRFRFNGGISFSMFEHVGLSAAGLGARVGLVPFWDLGLEAALQHEQWNDWRVGENRALGLVSARPLGRFDLGAGVAWRVPLLDPEDYWLPFGCKSDASELNIVYRAGWRILAAEGGSLTIGLSNLTGLRLYTPHHIAVQLDGRLGLGPGLSLTGHAGTAFKGLSGLIFAAGEFEAAAGVLHEL